MNRRNLHKLAMIASLTLLAVAIVPAVSFLGPDENIQSTGLQIDISGLRPGTFTEEKLQSSRVFILRDFAAKIHVYTVPYSDGAYWLPEFDWSRPAVPCASFGPDNTDGELVEDGAFRCWLPDYGEFFRREHSWSYDGRNLGYRTDDLKIAKFEIRKNTVVLLE